MNIISFIRWELFDTKCKLEMFLKTHKNETNVRNRLKKISKAIEVLDNIEVINNVYFKK